MEVTPSAPELAQTDELRDRVVEIRNLAPSVTPNDIVLMLRFCGNITNCEILDDTAPSMAAYERSRIARVTFATATAAETAEIMTGTVLSGRQLRVERLSRMPVPVESVTAVQSEEKEWDIVRGLGELAGKGFVIGQRAIDYLAAWDERHNISKTLNQKAQELDERGRFSASLNSIITTAREKWREFELNYPSVLRAEEKISNTFSVASERVNEASDKIRHAPVVSKGIQAAGSFSSAAQSSINAGLAASRSSEDPLKQQHEQQLPVHPSVRFAQSFDQAKQPPPGLGGL